MSARMLAGELRARGLTRLAQWADSLRVERDAALQDAWTAHADLERMRERLHQLVAENDALRRGL